MTTFADGREQGLGARIQEGVASLAGSPAFWLLFVALLFSWPIVRSIRAANRLPPPVPVLGTVPDFQLVDQRGATYGSEKLRGRLWVVNFIYTRCPSVCPVLTGHMSDLQHRVRNVAQVVHLVSISVDPEYDTPEVLAEYAKRHRASQHMWSFLTGPREDIQALVTSGMKIHMDGSTDDPAHIGHGGHFVLVDGRMQIRGYYDLDDDGGIDALLRDIGLLINRGG